MMVSVDGSAVEFQISQSDEITIEEEEEAHVLTLSDKIGVAVYFTWHYDM